MSPIQGQRETSDIGFFNRILVPADGSAPTAMAIAAILAARASRTANAGLLYTAAGTASLLAPSASGLAAGEAPFIVAGAMNIVAAILALVVVEPIRRRTTRAGE